MKITYPTPNGPPHFRFSWSDIRSYQACPRRWYFKTVLGLQVQQPDTAAPPPPKYPLLWGSAFHQLLDDIASKSPDRLSTALDAIMPTLPSDPKGIYTPQHLQSYAEALQELWPPPPELTVHSSEWAFVWPITPTIDYCGVLDLVVDLHSATCPAELKTTSRRSTIDRLLTLPIDWQALGYCCALSAKLERPITTVYPVNVVVHKRPGADIADLITLGPESNAAVLTDYLTQLRLILQTMSSKTQLALDHKYRPATEHLNFTQHCSSCGLYNRLCDYQPLCSTTGGYHNSSFKDLYSPEPYQDPPVSFEEIPSPSSILGA